MSKIKTTLAVLTVIPVLLTASCSQLGKMVAEGITETTSSLKGVACTTYYVNNLYSKKVNSTSAEIMGEKWIEGNNSLTVTFAKKQGVGSYKLDGQILADDEPLPYILGGAYAKIFDSQDLKPRKINIKTKSGDEAFISVDSPKPFTLISVNGEKDNAEVDLNSDLSLEFENFKNLDKNERLKVSFVMDVLGVREFVDIGVFKPTKFIRIPAAAFKNLSVAASTSGVAELKPGKNYIRVERYNLKKDRIPGFAASQVVSMAWQTMPVTLTGNSLQNRGIESKGDIGKNDTDNYMNYVFNVPNAFYTKPFSKAKKFALYSLSVRGLLKDVQTNTSVNEVNNIRTTNTTTITRQFPQLPDAYWEQLMNNSYNDITKLLKGLNIDLIPVQRVTSAKEYNFIEEINEVNTEREIVKKYKNTKTIMPVSFLKMVSSISSTFANDRPEIRLIDELGVDGLIGVAIDLVIDKKSDLIRLVPRMSIRMVGGANGYSVGPLTYANGFITGAGASFSESEFNNINALNRITRKDDMMKLLNKGIRDLIQKEKENGYEAIWALQ